ncbi:MAG: thioredoxin family protein [Bacteroidota bacterium]
MKILLGTFLVGFMTLIAVERTEPANQDKELGKVSWFRNYDEAIKEAQRLNKPIFCFFQEVPGCATCRNYGFDVMSDPIMVDFIENEFIPLCIFNNKKGHDAEILKMFGEPSWNNPVVRILDVKGNSVKRIHGKYSTKAVLEESIHALKVTNSVPLYAELYHQELSARQKEALYFQMYCFWSGEGKLGDIEGVVGTEPGWMNGAEVVRVYSDGNELGKKELLEEGEKRGLKYVDEPGTFREDKDPQYYLKNSKYASIPLLEIQKTRINSSLYNGNDPSVFLSPSQLKWLDQKSVNSEYEKNFRTTWWTRKGL